MKKIISQETFNETVRENIVDLEMNPELALAETIEQYEAQGVDLRNIVKTLEMVEGIDPVKEIVDKLKLVSVNDAEPEQLCDLIENLSLAKKLCSADLAYKLLAGKHGVYNTIMLILNNESNSEKIIESCLETLIALMDGYPDLLDEMGTNYILSALKDVTSFPILKLLLQWIWVCCIRHEINRQKFFSRGIVQLLKKFINVDMDPPVLKAACAVVWSMTLDDDVRALVPNAHNHACALAVEFLEPLTWLFKNVQDETILSEVVNALCSIIVRNEYCTVIAANDGLKSIMGMLAQYKTNQLLIRRLFKLLTNLAGNDDVRDDIIKAGAATQITALLNENMMDMAFAYAALLLISKLSLRVDKNGMSFIEAGTVELIVQTMKVHPGLLDVQRAGCWALRNISAHNKHSKELFMDCGVEDLMHHICTIHKEIAQDAAAVLIALNCDVQLTERWTGTSGDKLSGNNKT